jgi:hypothetical protein
MVDLILALNSLYPGKKWSLVNNDYYTLSWDETDIPIPTLEELTAECNRLQPIAEVQSQRFSRYPSVEEQLDMLYHLGYDGWKARIKEVKDSYPMPE